jgi:hypothetical protein
LTYLLHHLDYHLRRHSIPKTGDNNTAIVEKKKKKIESLHKVDENTNVDNENLVSDKNTRKISGVGKVKDLNETSRYNFMSDGGSRILKH